MTDKDLYAIVDENGGRWVVVDGGTEKVAGLPTLPREGWRPVRETPFLSDRSAYLYILIFMERDG